MAEKRLGIIMNGAGYEEARALRADGARSPVTLMSLLGKGVK